MDVKTLILGLLSFGDACGYELKKRFESLFRHFYSAGYGSIYPALAELADAGLVSCQSRPQERKPDRKVYRLTAAGKREFRRALRTTEPTHKLRSEFLAMIYFAELMDEERLTALLDDRLVQLQQAMQHIEEIRNAWGPDVPVGAQFVAGFGAMLAKAATDYINANRAMLLRAGQPPRQRVVAGPLGSRL
jgi:DNA-binding PadR family transcriptional regulator